MAHDESSNGGMLAQAAAIAQWLSSTIAGQTDGVERLWAIEAPVELLRDVERLRELLVSDTAQIQERRESIRVALFVNAPGGVPAPTYGSFWLENTLGGSTTRAVADFYRNEGLKSSKSTGPADYLPTEMEFVHFLLRHQHAARLTDQPDLEERGRAREIEFLESYVRPWLPAFCAAGRDATEDPFWLGTFTLLESFVGAELARLC